MKLVVANWKMNMDITSASDFVTKFNEFWFNDVEVVICPSMLHIPILHNYIRNSSVKIGAQDCSKFQDFGPKTGEVCAKMLIEFGVKYAILGHSERRNMGESDEDLILKTEAVLESGITPIICFGEQKDEYLSSSVEQIVSDKLGFLSKIKFKNKIIFAYEPIWSIGSGIIPDIHYIKSMINTAKDFINYDDSSFIYGGSVDINNAQSLLSISDGLLIGNASLNAERFYHIITEAQKNA